MLTCYISFSFFRAVEQKNEKILCLIKQRPHDYKKVYSKFKSIADKYCNISALKVLQYHMLY